MAADHYLGRIGMLRSKVGRGMFLLFVGCALLPVGVLALVAFLDVRTHLNDLSEKRLRQASKSTGMAILERLSFLETDLDLIAIEATPRSPGGGRPPSARIWGRAEARFHRLAILSGDQRPVRTLTGAQGGYPRLRAEEHEHVRGGGALVTAVPVRGAAPAVFIVRLLDPAVPDGDLIVGEIEPAYLWGGESFVAPSMDLCVLGSAGETLYASTPGRVPSRQLAAAMAAAPTGRFEWQEGTEEYIAGYWTLFMRPTYMASWVVIQSEPRRDVQVPLSEFGRTFFLIVVGTFLVVTFASLRQIRRRTGPVEQLLEATRRLKAEDFSHRVRITSRDEFAALGTAFNDMTESIERHLLVTNTMNRIGVSLSAEKDEGRLLETVLLGAQAVFGADAAALFLLRDGRVDLSLAHVKSLPLWQRPPAHGGNGRGSRGGGGGVLMPHAKGATERTIASPDVYDDRGDFAALIEFDRRVGYRSRSFMSVPLRNHEQEVIGILQLVNPQERSTGARLAFTEEDQRLLESLASQAAVAITKNRLVQDFKGLFEGLTDLISAAIDEQSPHTGGHVRRVVALSTMIAEAMPRSADPEVRARALSPEELYELRIAALLHDCGKLTTPVYLTDKATKLQAIIDRMRLVESRAETARRQHRIGLLKEAVRQLAPGQGRELLSAIESRAHDFDHQIEEDLAVLRQCNQGVEYMPDALAEHMREIGSRYSWANVKGEPETLLSEDEMYHLSTRSGTLTPEERQIVEGHVTSTIRMLERLPYPKHLRNVPRYAGAHHERLSGRGYPLKLAGSEIPIQGRIIALADVLEALTARDRPYRRAMSLTEAMRTLGDLALAGSLDAGLYELVVAEAIHQRYAEQYL